MRRSTIFAFVALAGLGCDSAISDSVTPEIVATIHVTSESPTINVRQQLMLATEFHDASGRALVGVKDVTWSSSDAATVSVDGSGVVQGVKPGGPVTITATQGGVTGSVSLTVVPIVRLQPSTALLAVAGTTTLTANSVDYLGAIIGPVTASAWLSSNTNVASVDASGHVTGVATGDVTITATVAGTQQSAQIEVGVPTPLDGTWTGAPGYTSVGLGLGSVATMIVTFGAVRSFDVSLPWTFLPGAAAAVSCVGHAVATGRFAVTANAFAFSSSFGGPVSTAISGQFADANNASMTYALMAVPATAFSCAAGITGVGSNVTAPGRTFTLTK